MGDDTPSSGIRLSMGVILTLVLVMAGVGIFLLVKTGLNSGEKKVNEVTTNMDESYYTDYEGQTLKGSKVQTLVKQYTGYEISMKVITGSVKAGTVYNYKLSSGNKLDAAVQDNASLVSGVSNVTANNYINPNASFKCTLVRDSNDVITQMVFTQQ